ncbi:hypothetical protein [Aquibacillus sediminis]|uniref:hypothetical protein n=1 Tax=Aquibacillus sediminis TaxID=2574734 RepID=UPI001108BFC2|nr:hypothetical protein [Aquibacillus sediminis]
MDKCPRGESSHSPDYISDRRLGFGFEKPNTDYMFWILEEAEVLPHRPRSVKSLPSHVYFTYDELVDGKERVRLAKDM